MAGGPSGICPCDIRDKLTEVQDAVVDLCAIVCGGAALEEDLQATVDR